MKKFEFIYYSLLSVLIISGCINTTLAQPKITVNEAKQLVEKTVLLTDREIYCVNEDVLFSAFNVSISAMRKADWSNVLYIELISPDGESIARRKCTYNEVGTTGTLRIPNNVLTGNYYLRAYTRWMRDYSPYSYFYKMIRVINPFRAELLESTGNTVINESEIKSTFDNSTDFLLKTERKIYNKREMINLEVSVSNADGLADKFVLSVIPKGTDTQLIPDLTVLQELKFTPDYIPETRGLSISGKVVNEVDSLPLQYTLVGLTIFKEIPENRNILTNEKGQFFFDLSRLEGEFEVFISAKSKGNQAPMILIDNDFSTQKIELPFVMVDLSEESKKLYQSLSFNSQIQELYRQQKVEDELNSFQSDSSFYGKPDFVLRMKDYIALPSIKDYIYELLPQVGIRHDGKKTTLKVLGAYSDLTVHDPLVLVDMVPIFDIDRVLAVQPDKIERIEVVSIPYVRGDIVFGGIVSMFSKKGDLAGIDLPSTGRFLNYNMLNTVSTQVAPVLEDHRIPDLRNYLYWNPDLKLNGTEPTTISFKAGDSSGDYQIVVRGIDKTGKVKVATSEIKVK